MVHGQQDISRKAAVSMFSGMAYKSITTTGESMEPTTSVWPTAIEEYVRWKKALSPHMPYSPECLEGALQYQLCRMARETLLGRADRGRKHQKEAHRAGQEASKSGLLSRSELSDAVRSISTASVGSASLGRARFRVLSPCSERLCGPFVSLYALARSVQ